MTRTKFEKSNQLLFCFRRKGRQAFDRPDINLSHFRPVLVVLSFETLNSISLKMSLKLFVLWSLLAVLVPPQAQTTSSCGFTEFSCADNQQCIPKSYQCDNQFDCNDHSDEFGCCKLNYSH